METEKRFQNTPYMTANITRTINYRTMTSQTITTDELSECSYDGLSKHTTKASTHTQMIVTSDSYIHPLILQY